MEKFELKALPLELKDVDKGSRTAIIAHAAYDNVDRTGDISRKGMFTKSWKENKSDIAFYFNHDSTQAPGHVTNVFEDEKKAYTQVKLGTHTLGNDVMIMMDEGAIKNASFGFYTIKSNPFQINGKTVRELKEVAHIETSALTMLPANAKAGVVQVNKWAQGKDVVKELKSHMDSLEKFCRNTTASDETIINILAEIKALNTIISGYDTEDTPDGEPSSSVGEMSDGDGAEALAYLKLINLQIAS